MGGKERQKIYEEEKEEIDTKVNKRKREKKNWLPNEVEEGVRWHTPNVVIMLCSVLERFFRLNLFCYDFFCFVFLGFWLVNMYLPKGLGSVCNEQKKHECKFPHVSRSQPNKSRKLILRSWMNLSCRVTHARLTDFVFWMRACELMQNNDPTVIVSASI